MRSTDLPAETRRILGLAWPVVLTSLNWTILHVTDVVVVGFTGTDQVAALGASRALTYVSIVVALGWLSGVLVRVSRADGAADLAATGKAFHQGLALAVALGLISGAVLLFFARTLLIGVGVEPHVVPGAAAVVRVMAVAFPFQLMIVTASYFLEGVSRPRRVMVVNLAMLPFNALLAWILSGGHWGAPELGAVGAALATTIANVLGAGAMLVAAWTLPRARERGVHDWRGFLSRETVRGIWGLLTFGVMPALASGLELAGFSVLIALSTQLGGADAHAFQIVFSIHNVTFAAALGLGSAAGVRVGNAVGEGTAHQAGHRAGIALVLSAAITGLAALVLALFARTLTGLFPAVPAVHDLAAAMLLIWAPFILFDGIQVVCVYALRSLGDQVVAGINSILAYFLVTGGVGLWLVHAGWGLTGLTLASGSGMVVAAALHGGRLAWVSSRLRSRS